MASENLRAALDIGTTRIVALVGEVDEEGRLYVIGHGEAAAEGLKRGVVVDMEKTVRSITRAVKDAQMTSATEIDRITVGIAGEHIRSLNSHGVVAVGRSDDEITRADIKRAIEAARTVAIPVDREIIHVIPQTFSVDDQSGIKDPIGMAGVRLEVEAHIVTASITTAKNIYRALERCHLEVDNMVLESLALAGTLLSDEETEQGIVMLDIGGDHTNFSVFDEGAIRHTAVIPLGGRNVTNDIAIGLRCSVDQAETLKLSHGCALASMADPEEMLTIPSASTHTPKEISRNVLASIIEPRMEEILSLTFREVKKAAVADMLTGGLVLTGGGALLSGTVQLAEQIFDTRVRVGEVSQIEHTPDELKDGRYDTAHGLLVHSFQDEAVADNRPTGRGWLKRFENWITKRF
jgi:cell division protein FtsA